MAETLSFPIEIPGAEEAKRDLGAIADAFERVGVESDSVGRSQQQLGQSLGGLRGALADVKDRGLEELSQKAGELGQRLGGVSGQVANVAIKSAAAFGGIGIAVTAVGAALAFAVQAWQEYTARVELANARSEELSHSVDTLGAAYPSMREAVEGATTAVEAHTRAIAENQRILGQQLELLNRGFAADQARAYTVQLQQVSGAVRELGTYLHGASEEQIRQTIESGSAAAQQELLGVAFQHSADAATENANRIAATTVLQQRAAEAVAAHKDELVAQAQAAVASARADAEAAAGLDDNGTAAASAARRVQAASEALTEAQNRAAEAHRNAAAGASEARAALDRLEASSRATAEQEQQAALARGYAAITRLAHEQARRHTATATRTDPLEELKQQIRLNQELMRVEDARASRENQHRERALELARIGADTDEERRQITERTIRLHGDELREARASAREQIEGNDRLVAAIERRATSLRGAKLVEANEQIRALHESTIDIQQRIAEADHRLSVEAATYAAAEHERIAQRRAATLQTEKDNLRAREERAKAETVEGARQARDNEHYRANLEARLSMTRTYHERMQDLRRAEVADLGRVQGFTADAFTAMTTAFAEHVTAYANDTEDLADALQATLSVTLSAISKEATAKAAFYLAEGFGMLAVGNLPASAAAFTAAAGFAAVAATTGIAGYATRTAGMVEEDNARASRGSSSGGGGERAASPSRGSAETRGGTTYNIVFGGPMYGTGGVRQAARQMVGAINRGGIQGGVQLLPGVLQGAGAGA